MRVSLILAVLLWTQMGFSQTASINAYEHVIVPMQFDFQDESNQYQVNILARVLLQDEGFKVYMDKEERPLKFMGNTCEALFLEVEDTSGILRINVVFRLKDCYDNVLFESKEGSTKIKDFQQGYQAALKDAFSSLQDEDYRYDSSLDKIPGKSVQSSLNSSSPEEMYPEKKIYKFGGETYWLVEKENEAYSLLANEGIEIYAELEKADKGTFIFKSKTITGAAFFGADGNLTVEYRDEDLEGVQSIIFRKIE